jgi:uncharacterized membrane protein YdjX (TVP38/TMEM64 family)
VLVLLLAGVVIAAVLGGLPDAGRVQEWIAPVGPLLFVPVCALACLVFVPKPLLSVLAGLLYGPAAGVPAAWAGIVLGAVLSFWLARLLGRDALAPLLAGGRLGRLERAYARRGLVSVIVFRLIPLVPFGLVNLGSGVTSLRARDFVLGTAVGVLPATALHVVVGAEATDTTSPQFLLVTAATLLLAVAGVLAARRLSRPAEDPVTSPR